MSHVTNVPLLWVQVHDRGGNFPVYVQLLLPSRRPCHPTPALCM